MFSLVGGTKTLVFQLFQQFLHELFCKVL